eukprot:Skav235096  [mRNA]  locus=scaffold711:93979:101486:- [translate_table: standard]
MEKRQISQDRQRAKQLPEDPEMLVTGEEVASALSGGSTEPSKSQLTCRPSEANLASWRRFRCRRDARRSQRELFDKRLADIQKAPWRSEAVVMMWLNCSRPGLMPSHDPRDMLHRSTTEVHLLGQQGRWAEAIQLLRRYEEADFQPDLRLLSGVVGACAKASRWQVAVEFLDQMDRSQLQSDVIMYNKVISACERKSCWQVTLDLLRQIQDNWLTADVISFTSSISACGKAALWRLSLQIFSELAVRSVEANEITFGAVITGCERDGKWQAALAVLEDPLIFAFSLVVLTCAPRAASCQDLQLSDLRESLVTYGATISACEKAGQWEAALSVLRSLKERRLSADVIAFNAAMSACEKGAQWQRAFCLMEDLADSKLKGTVVTYNALISACGRGGENWELVLALLQQMRQHEATTITYNAAISACEIGDHWEVAIVLFQDMLMQGLQPTVVTYNALMSACGKGGRWKLVMEVVEHMENIMINLDAISYNTAICSLEMGEKWALALHFLFDFWSIANEQRPGDVSHGCLTCNAAMAVCVRSNCWRESLALLRIATAMALPCNAVSYDLALKAAVFGQQSFQAAKILAETRQHVLKKQHHWSGILGFVWFVGFGQVHG